MRKVIAWIGGGLTVLVVSLTLAFGGHQAFAVHPSSAVADCSQFCPDHPDRCFDCCVDLGSPAGGDCVGGGDSTCACLL